MPVYDLGYRNLDPTCRHDKNVVRGMRIFVIAKKGIRIAWKSLVVRLVCLATFFSMGLFSLLLFMIEKILKERTPHEIMLSVQGLSTTLFSADNCPQKLVEVLGKDPAVARPVVWAYIFYNILYIQTSQVIILVGMIAADLISNDVRTRAFILYFSRPLTKLEYVLGKSAITAFYTAIITAVPALVLYVLGILFSPRISVAIDTWIVPLRILLASFALILPTTSLALAISSLFTESRYAAFSWFAVWVIGWVVWSFFHAMNVDLFSVSFFHILREIQAGVFGFSQSPKQLASSVAIAGAVFVVSSFILFRRISAPMRV